MKVFQHGIDTSLKGDEVFILGSVPRLPELFQRIERHLNKPVGFAASIPHELRLLNQRHVDPTLIVRIKRLETFPFHRGLLLHRRVFVRNNHVE